MIRIDEMSVRLGINTHVGRHKKGARGCASPGPRAYEMARRAGAV
jgi:hypothetical protein